MDVEQTHNKAAADTAAKFRGKLYALSHESAWEDTGTGFVSIVGSEDNKRLVFKDESDTILHDRPVFARDTYQLEGEGDRQTIIVWEDPETEKDWALSFQDPDGTLEIWEVISQEAGCGIEAAGLLPLPRVAALAECARMLACVPPSQRELLAHECLSPKFLAALREAFHSIESLGDEEGLTQTWQIIKSIFLLSNQRLTERYLAADCYEDILGMLEHDDGLPPSKRTAHRQVMKAKVRFSQVLSFEDNAMLARVHLNYRLQYLKDIVLPRLLDDAAFVSLNQMIHANISIILDYLQKSGPLMDRLFLQVREKDLQSLLFLQDLCRLSKQILPSERIALYEAMVERRLFEVLIPFISGGSFEGASETLRPTHCAAEILLLSAFNDPAPLRQFLTNEANAEGRAMLSAIVKLMLTEDDQGVQGQLCEMLKAIMDPSALEQRERDTCLDVFYERGGFDEMVTVLRPESGRANSFCLMFGQQLVCELLAFAVTNHGYRSKIYIVRHGLAQQAARLLTAPHRFLQLAPIRLIKAIVTCRDEAYHRYLTKNGVFAPLLRNFHVSVEPPALGGNLVISATLELLEIIRVENIKILVDHICKKHGAIIQEHAPKFKTLEGFLLKHQQNLEYEAFPPNQHSSGEPGTREGSRSRTVRRRSPGREDSDGDEAYFESLDEDEDDEVSTEGATGGQAIPQDSNTTSEQGEQQGAGLRNLLEGYEEDENGESDDRNTANATEALATPDASSDAVVAAVASDTSVEGAAGDADEDSKGEPCEADSPSAKEVQSLNHVAKRLRTTDSAPT